MSVYATEPRVNPLLPFILIQYNDFVSFFISLNCLRVVISLLFNYVTKIAYSGLRRADSRVFSQSRRECFREKGAY